MRVFTVALGNAESIDTEVVVRKHTKTREGGSEEVEAMLSQRSPSK